MTEIAVAKARLDKWLWHARFVKTRSLAARLCVEGRIRIDGIVVDKPAAALRPGQVLTFALGRHVRVIEVAALGTRRGPPAEARTLYRDLAPPAPETAMPRDLSL
jgi:ribosome-associated heat shock protein Hsp15